MRTAAIAVFLCLSCGSALQAQYLGYHIGNSLTVDSNPWALDALAWERAMNVYIGCHIRSSASLDYIWDHPLDNDFGTPPEPFGMYGNALPNYRWDYLSLQIHAAMSSTLGDDLSAIANFSSLLRSNPLNASTRIYLYTPWPSQPFDPEIPAATYADLWLRPAADNPAQPTVMSRAYYELLSQHTGLRQIPVGEVFYQIDQRLQAGALPGFTSVFEFYRDPVHANSYGKYVALATTLTVITNQDPTGLVAPPGFGEPTVYTQDFYDLVHEVIWKVAALRGDLNADGDINALDVSPFVSALTGTSPNPVLADLNRDGLVNAMDVPAFIDALVHAAAPHPVPEPAAFFGLGVLALLMRRSAFAANI